jgi:hypothetical protein
MNVSWEAVFLEVTPGVNYPDTGGGGAYNLAPCCLHHARG